MPPYVGRHIRELSDRLRSERAIALPLAMMALLVVSALSTVAAAAATSGVGQSSKDGGVKRALAAVDAGLQTALYRTNRISNIPDKCVTAGSGGNLQVADPLTDGWCPPQTEDLGEGSSYTYRVSTGTSVAENGQNLIQRRIVSIGCVKAGVTPDQCATGGGVKRRAVTTVAAVSAHLFGPGGVLSRETLTVRNNAYVEGQVASNDDVIVDNNGEICGNVTYGASSGDDFVLANNSVYSCSGTSATKAGHDFLLNPVDGSAARASNNNQRIGNEDTVTGTVDWDAANKILRIDGDSSLTLTGDVYSFCYLEVGNNAELRVASRAAGRPPLRVFIDKPENCGAAGSNRGSVRIENNGKFINLTSDPTMLQLYVEGSPSQSTSVTFQNNSETGENMSLVVYAPQSDLVINNNGHYVGGMAARKITIENGASMTWDPRMANVSMDTQLLFQRQSWTECAVEPGGSAPDAGC